jgi:hypothetical protein
MWPIGTSSKVHLHSTLQFSPDAFSLRLFLDRSLPEPLCSSSARWFATSSYKAIAKGQMWYVPHFPSSSVQLIWTHHDRSRLDVKTRLAKPPCNKVSLNAVSNDGLNQAPLSICDRKSSNARESIAGEAPTCQPAASASCESGIPSYIAGYISEILEWPTPPRSAQFKITGTVSTSAVWPGSRFSASTLIAT